MTDENKDIAKPEVLNLTEIGDETLDQSSARAVLAPQNLSTIVLASAGISGVPFNEIVHELNRQTVAINNGDMTRVEDMLTAQAHTLDALFTSLANTALQAKSLDKLETYMRLALKAQNQSRATLQTLGELKAPKQIAFVKQQNIGNQVQVNNGLPEQPARTRQTKKTQNKLLEVDHGQRLDTRATGTTGRNDSELEAVGKEHRSAKLRR